MSRLGRKQTLSEQDWLDMIAGIEGLVTQDYVFGLATRAIREIRETAGTRKAAYGWSGGKDSLVLQQLCTAAGVTRCFMVATGLEYPAMDRWVEQHKPDGMEYVRTGQDLPWLAEHQQFLFPQEAKYLTRWFSLVQWKGQRRYYEENKLDLLILGRRKIDGNFTGNNGGKEYANQSGMRIYNPIADWRHEDVYAYLHYNRIALPPVYGYKDGHRRGTHPWPIRKWTGTVENGWQEIWDIVPFIVAEASKHIESAKDFFDRKALSEGVPA